MARGRKQPDTPQGKALLAIDIGNTTVALGIFQGEALVANWRVGTGVRRLADEYAPVILYLLDQQGFSPQHIHDVVMCSVVPPLAAIFEEFCHKYFKVNPLTVGAGVKTGVRIATDNPREVGADRVVNAAAAHHLYGGPVIVIDLGTATTLDVVSKDGDYLGGAIAPGILIAAEALFTRTAQLPRVELVRPPRAIGRNSIASMQSGIFFGYIGLIEGLVSRIQKELKEQAKVIATGGLAESLARETSIIQEVNPHLTLLGLRLIYQMNRPWPLM
ncbi:MAG TPA: type III pantothenate kinase [Dehalococcoidia bacterium]|jgi:type III pantothenate kinase|nr:type III pantothenate kinase [Dehalococcoidia bacterium]